MAGPQSIRNDRAQSTDTIYGTAGVPVGKLALSGKDVGLDNDFAPQVVGTHDDGDTFAASDVEVVAAGVIGGDVTGAAVVHALNVDDEGRLEVNHNPQSGNLTDRSGQLTVAATAQTLAASRVGRKYLLVQNLDSSEDLWINFGVAAVRDKPSINIGPFEMFFMEGSFVSSQSVSVIATTINHKWTAKEA